MKSVGFIKSRKENEKRIALLPEHIDNIRNCGLLFLESGYGHDFGISDAEYASHGVNMVSREEALTKDIICDPKVGDAEYLGSLHNQLVFGWIHAVQNREITEKIISGENTAIAWEDMYQCGRHIFWRNNEIAGEAAVMHAYLLHGIFPYNTKVAVLGRGNVARGAIKILNFMGANVVTYDRRTENLFREELPEYDVVVNAILWDTSRKDHILYRNDLKRMKRGGLIIDVSCDRNGGIETSNPTSIDKPIYNVEGIAHYVVDHTPSLFFKTSSYEISKQVSSFIDFLIEDTFEANPVLRNAIAIRDGVIIDKRINSFQNRCVEK